MSDIGKMTDKQDSELIALMKDDSRQAFSELYIRYYDPLYYYCRKYLNDDTEAEDIVQDIFMHLWDTRDTLTITSSFSGYIYTAAHNRMLKVVRQIEVHMRYAQQILQHAKEDTNETEDSIIDDDYAALLNKMMAMLTPKQKEIFRLSRIDGLSYIEIAERLQISVPAVQKHVSNALEKIKRYLTQHKIIHFKPIIIFLVTFL